MLIICTTPVFLYYRYFLYNRSILLFGQPPRQEGQALRFRPERRQARPAGGKVKQSLNFFADSFAQTGVNAVTMRVFTHSLPGTVALPVGRSKSRKREL
ncbi:hypothetical protein SpAn4DRAFT_5121 [Sporomusa ovata]|uniref:Uncharacterized protein n=1 Tax=Sporomusa ovata TaxID=2378 RepID=A0A0U1L197_9FIRM|nr:hypothetical protein [Sporomusa ovata]CQR73460.1 hypothetical protein SpAn4DRAFT_5121 [Sporomusa ovata]